MTGLPRQLQLGDHCCQIFETAEDLGDLLVPYFKEGLERNEACIWVTREPYGKDRALSNMRAATDSFERRYARGQMQVFTHDEWYLRDGRLDFDNLIPRWLNKKDEAIASGYTGLRLTGNASFVEPADWPAFMTYERAVTQAFQGQPVAAVCSYCLAQTNVENLFEAMDSHAFTLRKRAGHWDVFGLRDQRLTSHLQGMELRDLIEDRLSVHLRSNSHPIIIDGTRVLLSAQQAHDLGLVFHELVTNAVKHGALASPGGQLNVRWRVALNGARRLCVEWAETRPAKPIASEPPGFGTHLIAKTVEKCARVFTPTGMVCTFELVLD